jgi:hypothetical protein
LSDISLESVPSCRYCWHIADTVFACRLLIEAHHFYGLHLTAYRVSTHDNRGGTLARRRLITRLCIVKVALRLTDRPLVLVHTQNTAADTEYVFLEYGTGTVHIAQVLRGIYFNEAASDTVDAATLFIKCLRDSFNNHPFVFGV